MEYGRGNLLTLDRSGNRNKARATVVSKYVEGVKVIVEKIDARCRALSSKTDEPIRFTINVSDDDIRVTFKIGRLWGKLRDDIKEQLLAVEYNYIIGSVIVNEYSIDIMVNYTPKDKLKIFTLEDI